MFQNGAVTTLVFPTRRCLEETDAWRRVRLLELETAWNDQKQVWQLFLVSVCGGDVERRRVSEKLKNDSELRGLLPSLAGTRLVCHCLPSQACQADTTVASYFAMFLCAFHHDDAASSPSSSAVLDRLAV